ncbi:MAG: hypothetical protein PHH16_00820 [Candidatus Gracilibacteria bacterium]|nr:hypothetical protein [Candidatus Gracilibacteria bacterium]
MNTRKEYIFGFQNGDPLYFLQREKESQAFEDFLQKILTPDQLKTREQMRYMECAIKTMVDEIMEVHGNQDSN